MCLCLCVCSCNIAVTLPQVVLLLHREVSSLPLKPESLPPVCLSTPPPSLFITNLQPPRSTGREKRSTGHSENTGKSACLLTPTFALPATASITPVKLAGAAILGVGIWVKVDSGSILGLLKGIKDVPAEMNQILNVGYLLIAVGAVLLIIGFLGCCGAMKESRCMLLLFFVIVLVVFIAEVAGAVVILVFKPLAGELIEKLGTKVVQNIKKDYGENVDVTALWNATMDTLKCCGFYNYTDFTGSPFEIRTHLYPQQCCHGAVFSSCNDTSATITGCFPKFKQLIDENTIGIVAVALGIAALEILAMVVSMTLYCIIGSKSD
uniref:Tetraspanin 34b n=1 Tax=Oncorhynchus mykiss TaxID=8022 RepID=A0A8C7RXS1_ONCMY